MNEAATSRRVWALRPVALAVILTGAVVVAALSVHVYALSLDRTARDTTLGAPVRVNAARRAASLEPFNPRVQTTYALAKAQELVRRGRVDEAYVLLLPLSTTVRGDALFRATYQDVVRAKWPLDARKAHQQHAREATDGVLAPDDVLR